MVKANSHLDLEDIARNVPAYYERSHLSKFVCGTYGTRDTDDHYIKEVKLTDLSKDRWLRVDEIAFDFETRMDEARQAPWRMTPIYTYRASLIFAHLCGD